MEPQQLTLGGLVEALDAVPREAQLYVSGFGSANRLSTRVFRHRPYVDGIKLEPAMQVNPDRATAGAFLNYLRRAAFGLVCFTEDRDDEFPAGWDTPVWVSAPYVVSFHAVTGVEIAKGAAVVRTTDMAPMQGPSLQRIPDEEVINRMRVADLDVHGRELALGAAAEKHLIRYIAKDRSTVLQNLAEAREDLASFEASLQAKKDRVAKLERDAVRHDYLLGIRDDLPGARQQQTEP